MGHPKRVAIVDHLLPWYCNGYLIGSGVERASVQDEDSTGSGCPYWFSWVIIVIMNGWAKQQPFGQRGSGWMMGQELEG